MVYIASIKLIQGSMRNSSCSVKKQQRRQQQKAKCTETISQGNLAVKIHIGIIKIENKAILL